MTQMFTNSASHATLSYPSVECFQPTLFEVAPVAAPTTATPDVALPSAALSDIAASHLSERYGMIRSFEIVAQLRTLGFKVTGGRGETPLGSHSMYLTHPSVEVEGFGVSIDAHLEIGFSIQNSHDGSSCYRASLALKDHATADVIPLAHEWSEVKIRHNIHIAKTAAQSTHRLADSAARVATSLEALQAVTIGESARYRLALYALRVRWGEKRQPISVDALLKELPMNENLYRQMRWIGARLLDGGTRTTRGSKTRRVRQPNERLRVLRELWAYCERVASGDA